MTDDRAKSGLAHFADRCRREPFFLGYRLARYAERYGLSHERMLARLDCDADQWQTLEMCRAPGWEGADREADLDAIAGRFGLDREALEEMTR